MKKAIIITPFDNYSYQVRIKYVEKYLIRRGYDVKITSSDFNHRNKTIYTSERDNLELIHVPPYTKNLSYARIKSHYVFAKKALKKLEVLQPDIVYCSAPPNYLFKYISKYKLKHPTVKLLYEVGDLWPETLPLQGIIKKIVAPVMCIWARIRDRNIKFADAVIYECMMFSDVVAKNHPNIYSEVIYLSKEDYYKGEYTQNNNVVDSMRFAYVGSINNIIDVDMIVNLVGKINSRKKAKLIIIGGGENADRMLKLCDEFGISYENYGVTYDENEKHRILATCQFGLNIMKESVAVGATMKSLEYFHEGLILVNNIPADTAQIVKRFDCGFNIEKSSDCDNVVEKILQLTEDEIVKMRYKSRMAYEELFDSSKIDYRLDKVFTTIGA